MKRSTLSSRIRNQWASIVGLAHDRGLRGSLRGEAFAALPSGSLSVASTSSKISKGEASGILTAVVYLAPAGEAVTNWRQVCPGSNSACRASCLIFSGHMAMTPARRARLWRTALYLGAPDLFWALVRLDLERLAAKAARLGMRPAFRVNGTSDIETPSPVIHAARELGVTLYGYTKLAARAISATANGDHEVYSWDGSEHRRTMAHHVLNMGGRVSVVFDGELPATWDGFRVVDGDETDAVFTRPPGVVLGLRLKGRKKAKKAARRGGFAVRAV